MNIFFQVTETLGSVAVDTSGRIIRVDAYSYVPPILDRLSTKKGFALGAILNNGAGFALDRNAVLQESGISRYLSPDLLIEATDAGFGKRSVETFEAALAHAQSLGKAQAKDSVFVSGNRGDRTTATVVGMKAAPHLLLAEAVAPGEDPPYAIAAAVQDTETISKSFDQQASFAPFYQANVNGNSENVALSTEGMTQGLRADFDVEPLSKKVDAVPSGPQSEVVPGRTQPDNARRHANARPSNARRWNQRRKASTALSQT